MPSLISTDLPGGLALLDTWKYPSLSGGDSHTVSLWTDGYISCSCKGWIIKKPTTREKFGQDRWCKHVGDALSEAELTYLASTGGKPARRPVTVNSTAPSRRPIFVPNEPPSLGREEAEEVMRANRKPAAKTENISLRPTRAFDV